MRPSPSARPWLAAGALLLVGLAAYLPALGGGFVFDDGPYVASSPLLEGPLWRIWLTTDAPDYWPLTSTTLWLERRLWGEAAAGYHATNLALHLGAALLLWRVLEALRVPGAWLAALLFTVHPVTVDSAAWISERKNTLSAVLLFGAALRYVRFDDLRRRRDLALSLLLFALALLAKTSGVMLPVVLLGLAWQRRGRVSRADLASAAPFFALSLAAGLVTLWFHAHRATEGLWLPPRSLAERVGGAGLAALHYLAKAFVPVRVASVYPEWPVSPASPGFYVPALLLAGALAALVALRRRPWARALLLGLGYHLVMLLPVLGLVDMAYHSVAPVANHLQYLALPGPAALAGAALAWLGRRAPWPARAAAAGAVLLLAASTHGRARAFESDRTFWEASVRAAPEAAFARMQLAATYEAEGRRADALRQLEAASSVARDPAARHVARAYVRLYLGLHDEAVEEAREAARLRPSGELRRLLGMQLVLARRPAEAVEVLAPLLAESPLDADRRYWLAAALEGAGRGPEAIATLRAGVRPGPGDPRLVKALALALVRAGRGAEAIQEVESALGLAPGDPRARAQVAAWIEEARPRRR